ncbi:MAG: FAD-dependent oxidoreductase [Spirochaetales bacterium]|nr:FAD-dependent oxidoreductase [Spirochaetales bacterium]MCF7939057.1 FAD-dependent oxidoreductase [Spirochaetales bacterium]
MEALLASGDRIRYEKLVLATGSRPRRPDIPGIHLDGVHLIHKNYDYLQTFREEVRRAKKIFIVGGGFISLELADELLKLGKPVTTCCRSHILRSAFDSEFCEMALEQMEELGAEMIDGTKINRIEGNREVEAVILDDGTRVETDLVIFAVGYEANTGIAEYLGLETREGTIWTDEYLRTSDPDTFAVGDCAIKREYFSRIQTHIMLASTAMAEGRLVGSNLYHLNVVRAFKGTLGTFSTRFGNLSLGSTGLSEKQAQNLGFNYTVGQAAAPDRHPGSLDHASTITLKLIFSANSHTLLGAQAAGGESVGELINILSVMIQKGCTDTEIDTLQLGTHPLLTPSPVAYPIINASADAMIQSGWGENIETAAAV